MLLLRRHPFPVLRIEYGDGTPYTVEEEVKLSVVTATDKLTPPRGRLSILECHINRFYFYCCCDVCSK
jgi:hypothetical protein